MLPYTPVRAGLRACALAGCGRHSDVTALLNVFCSAVHQHDPPRRRLENREYLLNIQEVGMR